MSSLIRTNQLVYTLNYEEIDKKYDIFVVQTTEKYFRYGAYILDAPILEGNVCSVCFLNGKEFYVLMYHNEQNKKLLKEALFNAKGGDTVILRSLKSKELKNRSLLQLLLNSLGSIKHPSLRFNNLTGHLYCFHPDWIDESKGIIWKVPCLELKLTSEYHLKLDVCTFTSVRLKNKITFKNQKFEDYPKYVLSMAHKTLRRKLKDDKEPAFIKRQVDGEKSSIDYLNILNFQAFSRSKMGILAETVLHFNEVFKNMAYIDFEAVSEYDSLNDTKENKNFIKEKLQIQEIRIVDMIGDESSKKFCKEMKEHLFEEYQITVKIGKRPDKNCLNLCLIHEASYYHGKDDPHQKQYPDTAIQHITLENFADNVKYATSTVIHELLIKSDLQDRKIRLFDWSKLGLTEDISFGIAENIEENVEHYFFMCIHPDGTFFIEEQEPILFEQIEYSQCTEIFSEPKNNPQDFRGIIRDNHGNINIIDDTDLITIPEIFDLRQELENGNTKLRNGKKRELLLPSVTDIRYFQKNGNIYYFSGVIGYGMKPDVHTAMHIRKVKPYEDAPLFFEKLLPLMNVRFVRNKQLTVYPFPFKYLREHLQQLKNNLK
ncbi:MAG: hypothetical protein K2O42_09725 [Oscillospiraceae bacterium]|nr:hypothetical protein [Oscillospiraceae bacterium]